MRRHPWRCLCLAGLLAFAALNGIAYTHARAMTHFVSGGIKTPHPEALSPAGKLGVLVSGVRVPRPENLTRPDDIGLASTTHRFPSADHTLEAWLIEAGPSHGMVVLFHGYSGSRSDLLPQAAAFHELGFACLLVDFRGSGGSTGATTTIGFGEADDVVAAVAYARNRLAAEAVFIYGVSMGAAASLRALGPLGLRADGLIVESPFDRLLSTVENRFALMGLPSFPCAPLLVFWGGVQHGYSGFAHNPCDYARQVETPTLMLVGAVDQRATEAQALAVYDRLAGPRSLVRFAGAGHESFLEHDPRLWKRTVGEFLQTMLPPQHP